MHETATAGNGEGFTFRCQQMYLHVEQRAEVVNSVGSENICRFLSPHNSFVEMWQCREGGALPALAVNIHQDEFGNK